MSPAEISLAYTKWCNALTDEEAYRFMRLSSAERHMVFELRTDISAFDRYSKWEILKVKDWLKGLPEQFDKRLTQELDFVRESL